MVAPSTEGCVFCPKLRKDRQNRYGIADFPELKMAHPVPIDVLLPLSYALSRPLVANAVLGESPVSALPATILLGIFFRLLEHGICAASPGDDNTEPPWRLLGALVQLLGSASLWLLAELAVRIAADHPATPATTWSAQTLLGVCGISLTAVGFGIPVAWLRLQKLASFCSRISPIRRSRSAEERMAPQARLSSPHVHGRVPEQHNVGRSTTLREPPPPPMDEGYRGAEAATITTFNKITLYSSHCQFLPSHSVFT
jgi:hypothetical protein